ncbi:hypothetical protein FQN49_004771 [Arthroderma sp. PD_2]|nr:hypothetical protein FQN49_004771 [Arthroderma sp. PD_2]
MRAKRSKKYRKLMHQYELTFGFREPYQVLVDSHCLQSVYNFKMDLVPALERTVQGKVKPFVTKCSLAAMMAMMASQTPKQETTHSHHPQRQFRPPQLPPPTILPLRYCSHNADSTPIDEAECLLSLLSPSSDAKKKNKEHYILATADPAPVAAPQQEQKRKRPHWMQAQEVQQQQPQGQRYNLRRDARQIPGVPIIYVKRSVMILEPMSEPSSGIREGFERGKLRSGFVEGATVTGKRKRDADGEGDGEGDTGGAEEGGDGEGEWVEVKRKKVKGVNPLSAKKPKKKESRPADKSEKAKKRTKTGDGDAKADAGEKKEETGEHTKSRRKRRHKKKADGGDENDADTPIMETEI